MSESKAECNDDFYSDSKENVNPDGGDEVFLAIPSLSMNSPSSALPKMGGLNIGKAMLQAEEKDTSEEAEMVRDLERTVTVIFDLPDGSQIDEPFKVGQSVEYLKSFLAIECGIAMQTCVLYFDEKVMIDPLSLVDFKGIEAGMEVDIRVEGEMEEDMRK